MVIGLMAFPYTGFSMASGPLIGQLQVNTSRPCGSVAVRYKASHCFHIPGNDKDRTPFSPGANAKEDRTASPFIRGFVVRSPGKGNCASFHLNRHWARLV